MKNGTARIGRTLRPENEKPDKARTSLLKYSKNFFLIAGSYISLKLLLWNKTATCFIVCDMWTTDRAVWLQENGII